MELKRRGRSVFLQLIDSAALFITPRTPAGVSYITAKPSQTDGHSGERKKRLQNTAGSPGRKQGRGCDGWVHLTRAGRKAEIFPSR